MSAFLGHIHYWLYNKIRLVTERESRLYEAVGALCGDTAEEVREQVYQSYGYPLPHKDLAELIDQTNIHGWLQRQINIAETREAATIQAFASQCGSAAVEAITQVVARQGQECGHEAADSGKYNLTGAAGLYQALNDYRLNGMPCDQNDVIVANEPNEIIWHSQENLAARNWQRAAADSTLLQALVDQWIDAFVTAANPAFLYSREDEGAIQIHKISRLTTA